MWLPQVINDDITFGYKKIMAPLNAFFHVTQNTGHLLFEQHMA
jgi:hypothetical protein